LDELSTVSPTKISQLRDGKVTTQLVTAEQFGMEAAKMEDFAVSSAEDSASRIRAVLSGYPGRARDIVVLNAAAALAVAGKADDITGSIAIAEQSIDSGRAGAALDKLVEVSNS